jgi:tetratricopeptide (TPR) repeat protein
MSESLREGERLAEVLARAGDEDGARLAQAGNAFILFAMGRAEEAARRAASLVELGPGDEKWRREARQSRGVSLVWGPTPVEEAIALIEDQRGTEIGALRGIARLRASQGRFAEARELTARARTAFEDLGSHHNVVSTWQADGDIEHMAGNLEAAARLARESYEAMTATGDRSYASTTAANLGAVLVDLHEDDEAYRFGTIARETSSSDDVVSQAGGRAVQARVLSRRGDHEAAEAVGREAVAIMARTDYLSQHAGALVDLAHVLREAGKLEEAVASAREALALYDRKGATFFVEKTQRLIDEWSA